MNYRNRSIKSTPFNLNPLGVPLTREPSTTFKSNPFILYCVIAVDAASLYPIELFKSPPEVLKLVDVTTKPLYTLPPLTHAKSSVPSADDVTEVQFCEPVLVISLQFAPESTDVHILPPITVAVRFVPSTDDFIDCQFSGEVVLDVQFTPESVDVHILPPLTHAASFVPSEDDVIDSQFSDGDVVNTQVLPESVDLHILPP
jgi:hypothetical protein